MLQTESQWLQGQGYDPAQHHMNPARHNICQNSWDERGTTRETGIHVKEIPSDLYVAEIPANLSSAIGLPRCDCLVVIGDNRYLVDALEILNRQWHELHRVSLELKEEAGEIEGSRKKILSILSRVVKAHLNK